MGTRLQLRLGDLRTNHRTVADVRGLGLMIGVELRDASGQPAAALADRILKRMKDAGYLLGKTGPGRNVLTFMPPLVVGPDDLDGAVEALDAALREAAG